MTHGFLVYLSAIRAKREMEESVSPLTKPTVESENAPWAPEMPASRGQNSSCWLQGGADWGFLRGTTGHVGTSPSEGAGLGRAVGTMPAKS